MTPACKPRPHARPEKRAPRGHAPGCTPVPRGRGAASSPGAAVSPLAVVPRTAPRIVSAAPVALIRAGRGRTTLIVDRHLKMSVGLPVVQRPFSAARPSAARRDLDGAPGLQASATSFTTCCPAQAVMNSFTSIGDGGVFFGPCVFG